MAILEEIFVKEARQQVNRSIEDEGVYSHIWHEFFAIQRLTLDTPDRTQGLATNSYRDKPECQFLEKGLKFYEQLAQTNATSWSARQKTAEAYASVGLLQTLMNNNVESAKAYQQAVHRMQQLAKERPEDLDNRLDLADAYLWSFLAYRRSSQSQRAEEAIRQALALFEKLDVDFPGKRSQVRQNIAFCQQSLAFLLQEAGKREEAAEAVRQALDVYEKLAADYPAEIQYRRFQAGMLCRWGMALNYYTRFDEAEKAFRQALALFKKLEIDDPGDPLYRQGQAYTYRQLGHLLSATGPTAEAEKAYRHSAADFETLADAYPGQPGHRRQLGYTLLRLAENLLRPHHRFEEEEEVLRQALAHHEKLVTSFPGNTDLRSRLDWNLRVLAENLLQQGKHAEAEKVAEKMPSVMPEDSKGYRRTADFLARCVRVAEKDAALPEADRTTVAKRYADRSQQLMREADREASLLEERSRVDLQRGQYDEAARDYAAALSAAGSDDQRWSIYGGVVRDVQVFSRVAALRRRTRIFGSRGGGCLPGTGNGRRRSASTPPLVERYGPTFWAEHYARLLVLTGNDQEYRRLCRLLDKLQGDLELKGRESYTLAVICTAGPQSGVESARIIRWAENAVGQSRSALYLFVLGAAHYRAGNYERAAECLEESDAKWGGEPTVHNSFLRAMTYHRLGQNEKSRRCYAAGLQLLRKRTLPPGSDSLPNDALWNTGALSEWQHLNMMHREAKAVLGLTDEPGPNTERAAPNAVPPENNADDGPANR